MTQTPASKVDFSNLALLKAVYDMGANHKCNYLIPLAAWQRGLTVEFFGSQAAAGVHHLSMPAQSAAPDLFRITDGSRSHFFNRSIGDATPMSAAVESKNKVSSKVRFRQFGVPTTPAIVWTGHNAAQVQAFVAHASDKAFVIKPIEGSGAKNTYIGVRAADVLSYLERLPKSPMLVELRIIGPEFRVYVVGKKVAAAHLKTRIFVIGNGTDSIAALIAKKNALRASNPSVANCQIDVAESEKHLAQYGLSLDHVPPVNQRVILGTLRSPLRGADSVNVTEKLHPSIARAAIGACAAVGLPNAGVDIMADASGPYVLEVNARALLHRHSFPTQGEGMGNAVAEAIVDWYFPTPDGTPAARHRQFFDSAPLLATFAKDGVAAYYKLPPAAV